MRDWPANQPGKWYVRDRVGRWLADLDSPIPKCKSYPTRAAAIQANEDGIHKFQYVYRETDPAEED